MAPKSKMSANDTSNALCTTKEDARFRQLPISFSPLPQWNHMPNGQFHPAHGIRKESACDPSQLSLSTRYDALLQELEVAKANHECELQKMRSRHQQKFLDATETIRSKHKHLAKCMVVLQEQHQGSLKTLENQSDQLLDSKQRLDECSAEKQALLAEKEALLVKIQQNDRTIGHLERDIVAMRSDLSRLQKCVIRKEQLLKENSELNKAMERLSKENGKKQELEREMSSCMDELLDCLEAWLVLVNVSQLAPSGQHADLEIVKESMKRIHTSTSTGAASDVNAAKIQQTRQVLKTVKSLMLASAASHVANSNPCSMQ